MLDTNDGLRSVAIPGGRRALRSARPVSLYIADDYADVKVRVPSTAGAIMMKIVAALDLRTSDGERHIQDVAFLLSLPFELRDIIDDLEPGDQAQLTAIGPQLSDPNHLAWEQCPTESQDRAIAAYQTLLRRST